MRRKVGGEAFEQDHIPLRPPSLPPSRGKCQHTHIFRRSDHVLLVGVFDNTTSRWFHTKQIHTIVRGVHRHQAIVLLAPHVSRFSANSTCKNFLFVQILGFQH